jgi:hypothetical protein
MKRVTVVPVVLKNGISNIIQRAVVLGIHHIVGRFMSSIIIVGNIFNYSVTTCNYKVKSATPGEERV